MATKILNLDEIETGTEKSFVWKGKTHVMQPLSVGEYVNQLKRLGTLKDDGEASVETHVEFMIDAVCKAFPTIDRSEVEAMDLKKIQMLSEYVNAEVEAESEEGNVE